MGTEVATTTTFPPMSEENEAEYVAQVRAFQRLKADNAVLRQQVDDLTVTNRVHEATIVALHETARLAKEEAAAARKAAETLVHEADRNCAAQVYEARQERDSAIAEASEARAFLGILKRTFDELEIPSRPRPKLATRSNVSRETSYTA